MSSWQQAARRVANGLTGPLRRDHPAGKQWRSCRDWPVVRWFLAGAAASLAGDVVPRLRCDRAIGHREVSRRLFSFGR